MAFSDHNNESHNAVLLAKVPYSGGVWETEMKNPQLPSCQRTQEKFSFLIIAITITKKNCKPIPNKNPVISLLTLLDSR